MGSVRLRYANHFTDQHEHSTSHHRRISCVNFQACRYGASSDRRQHGGAHLAKSRLVFAARHVEACDIPLHGRVGCSMTLLPEPRRIINPALPPPIGTAHHPSPPYKTQAVSPEAIRQDHQALTLWLNTFFHAFQLAPHIPAALDQGRSNSLKDSSCTLKRFTSSVKRCNLTDCNSTSECKAADCLS